jgi:hypothetical protein
VSHPLNSAFGECDVLGISSLVSYPSVVVCSLIKSCAEFENSQQNCTTTSGAFRSRTPVTFCDGL